MKDLFFTGVILTLVLALFPSVCRPGDFNISHWSHMADIDADKSVTKGIVEFKLTPQVFDLARRDLRDLRVVANRSEEMGLIHRTPRPHSYKVPLQARLYNRSYVPNERSSVTVDFGHKLMKNSTAGRCFQVKPDPEQLPA